MVAIKASDAGTFLKRLDKSIAAFLFHGTDPGLVSELARTTALALAGRDSPPGEILRIEDADLETDPDRLLIEVQTIPMFAASKVIRTTAGRRINGPMLAGLIETGPPAAALVVEAGSLKPTDALRKAFEKAAWAAAIPCYADGERDLETLVRDVLGAAGITAAPQVRDMIVARLGADRALSRQELDKLVIYAGAGAELSADDVDQIVGDAAEQALDRVAHATASGRGPAAVVEYDRVLAAGQSAQGVVLAIQRHFLHLHRLRALVSAGRSPDEAVRQMRPPVHFKVQAAFIEQVRIWDEGALSSATMRIAAAVKASRLSGALEDVLVGRLLLELAAQAKSLSRRPAGRSAAYGRS